MLYGSASASTEVRQRNAEQGHRADCNDPDHRLYHATPSLRHLFRSIAGSGWRRALLVHHSLYGASGPSTMPRDTEGQ
jgi:hypothetical protein